MEECLFVRAGFINNHIFADASAFVVMFFELGFECSDYANHILTAYWAFSHLLPASGTSAHMPTLEHDTIYRVIHANFA